MLAENFQKAKGNKSKNGHRSEQIHINFFWNTEIPLLFQFIVSNSYQMILERIELIELIIRKMSWKQTI